MVRGWAEPIRAESRTRWVGEPGSFFTAWERAPYVSPPAVQTMLNFANHSAGKSAKPEQFVDNSAIGELEKSGFIVRLYKQ
jgi:hypothetical protein